MSVDVDKVTGAVENVGDTFDMHTSWKARRSIQVIDEVIDDGLEMGSKTLLRRGYTDVALDVAQCRRSSSNRF